MGQASLPYILAHNKTFPAYMEMDVKTDAEAKFMFITKTKHNVLPIKYCSYYLGLNEAMTSLSITSPMVCRNTYDEMQKAVQLLDYQSGPVGYVDNLDPTKDTLDSLEHEINLGAGSVQFLGYSLFAILCISPLVCKISSMYSTYLRGVRQVTKDVSKPAADTADVQVQV